MSGDAKFKRTGERITGDYLWLLPVSFVPISVPFTPPLLFAKKKGKEKKRALH